MLSNLSCKLKRWRRRRIFIFCHMIFSVFFSFFFRFHFLRLIQCQRYEKLFPFQPAPCEFLLYLRCVTCRSPSLSLGLWLSVQGVERSPAMWAGWGLGLKSCVTTWGKRYKVLIKIVFSSACYYKGACSQVGYRLGSGLRYEWGLGMWLWSRSRSQGGGRGKGWPGWAASGRAASHHSSCLCMHIKVKISNGDNDGTHSWALLRRTGLVWAIVNG